VAVLGVAATIAMLATPTGTHDYIGSRQQMQALERAVSTDQIVDDETLGAIAERAQYLASRPGPEIEMVVRRTLRECGKGCADLTPAIVMRDRDLLEKALFVAELERATADGSRLTARQIDALFGTR
jgi:hypothetical protein